MEEEDSMQKHLFLKYQFQQHPQVTLFMKRGFYFFPRDVKTPRKQPKENLFAISTLPPAPKAEG